MFTMSHFSFGSICMVKNAFRLIPQYAALYKVHICFGGYHIWIREYAQIRLRDGNSVPSRQRSAWNLFRLISVVSLLVIERPVWRTYKQNKENGEPITGRGEH